MFGKPAVLFSNLPRADKSPEKLRSACLCARHARDEFADWFSKG